MRVQDSRYSGLGVRTVRVLLGYEVLKVCGIQA